MDKKKLFISQPMRGKTKEEIMKEREEAISLARMITGDEFEVIDSYFEDAPEGAEPLWYLGKSLQLLSSADFAVFAEGWDKARGCKIEHECAEEYGIPFVSITIE